MKKFVLLFLMFVTVIQLQAQKTHTIGERFGGGIIFDVTPDGQHGLIAKTQDQGMYTWNQARALISDPSNKNKAGKATAGWRLPEKDELDKLFDRKQIVGGFTGNRYWSSTENGKDRAWNQIFASGDMAANAKTFTMYVRAVRQF